MFSSDSPDPGLGGVGMELVLLIGAYLVGSTGVAILIGKVIALGS